MANHHSHSAGGAMPFSDCKPIFSFLLEGVRFPRMRKTDPHTFPIECYSCDHSA